MFVHKSIRLFHSHREKLLEVKAVLKCPMTGVKISNALLKRIFRRNGIKFGCMIIEKEIHVKVRLSFLSVLQNSSFSR